MAREFVEDELASEADLERMRESNRRLREAVGHRAERGFFLQITW